MPFSQNCTLLHKFLENIAQIAPAFPHFIPEFKKKIVAGTISSIFNGFVSLLMLSVVIILCLQPTDIC